MGSSNSRIRPFYASASIASSELTLLPLPSAYLDLVLKTSCLFKEELCLTSRPTALPLGLGTGARIQTAPRRAEDNVHACLCIQIDRVALACRKLFLGFRGVASSWKPAGERNDFMIVSPRMCVDEGLRRYEPCRYHDSRPASL